MKSYLRPFSCLLLSLLWIEDEWMFWSKVFCPALFFLCLLCFVIIQSTNHLLFPFHADNSVHKVLPTLPCRKPQGRSSAINHCNNKSANSFSHPLQQQISKPCPPFTATTNQQINKITCTSLLPNITREFHSYLFIYCSQIKMSHVWFWSDFIFFGVRWFHRR